MSAQISCKGMPTKLKIGYANTRLPTSIDNMTPTNRFVQTLATIPVTPRWRRTPSSPSKATARLSKGTTEWLSTRARILSGVESELVVNSGHSAQGNPHTVEEVRRILLLHAAETCEQTGIACIRPAGDNGRSTTISQVQAR